MGAEVYFSFDKLVLTDEGVFLRDPHDTLTKREVAKERTK